MAKVYRVKRGFRAFLSDKKGTAIVEFGLVAFPFFFAIIAIIEISMVFIANTVLESGVEEVSRSIRTGQAQNMRMNGGQFRRALCGRIDFLLDCRVNRLIIDVSTFGSFGASSFNDPFADGRLNGFDNRFNAGGPGDVVLMQTFYKWDLFTPLLSTVLAAPGQSHVVLRANVAFRNENFAP